jgi:hypothetical protein
LQWGKLGQDVDYTAWIANGPSFDSTLPTPVVGQTLNPQNNIGINTNGRALGARFRIYPFPLDANLAVWSSARPPTTANGRIHSGSIRGVCISRT